jgi:DDE superfamily endonuclease
MMSFLKNLEMAITNNPERPIYFFDESRFGTHSKLGHGWFKKGSRTQVKVRLGFENFYIYGAVDPSTGNDLSLMMDKLNTDMMNIFLSELSAQLGDQNIILIMDNARWHKSKNLKIPGNIEIMYLPPYSPELNPVERLWEHIKAHTIRNKMYLSIKSLEEAVANFIQSTTKDTIMSVCSTSH